MQNYSLSLESEVSKSFRCINAANSQDIDTKKKSTHSFSVNADIESDFNVGLIVGASGSGKTTLATHIYGEESLRSILKNDKPILDQFPDSYSYDECAKLLLSIGLSSVPCWIRPTYTLSNGQKARAECALKISKNEGISVYDEWTSVVDRTIGKIMSHAIQKFARKENKKIVLLSCHYDVIDWLNPDWVIDCNKQSYEDRRLLWRDFKRAETLTFTIKEIGRESWRYFSKYHYLSDKLPGGLIKLFGLFIDEEQIGFQCFAEYVPRKLNKKRILHFNRTVIHPDYVGLGLGMKFINETSQIIAKQGYRVMGKFSNLAVYSSMTKDEKWVLKSKQEFTPTNKSNRNMRDTGFRNAVRTYSFEFIG